MLSPYMSPIERVWFYSLRILCGLILLFLILPVLVIIPLSFNSGSFLVYPLQGFSLHWYQDFFGSAEWMRALKVVEHDRFLLSHDFSPYACALKRIKCFRIDDAAAYHDASGP